MARLRPAIGLVLFCTTGAAFCASPPGRAAAIQHSDKAPTTPSSAIAGLGSPVSTGALQRYSGGGLVTNNQAITGTVSDDSASNVNTGTNTISGNSFENAAGLPSVVQNTGNNVLIQTGVIVNVQLKP